MKAFENIVMKMVSVIFNQYQNFMNYLNHNKFQI